jgi:hypothetical protein
VRDVRDSVLRDVIGAFWQTDYMTAGVTHHVVAITNPPYSLAEPVIRKMLQDADRVAVLMRLSFLSSSKRAEWLRSCPPDVWVLPNRPSFADRVDCLACGHHWLVAHNAPASSGPAYRCDYCNGDNAGLRRRSTTDATDYAWLTWPEPAARARKAGSLAILATTPAKERRT